MVPDFLRMANTVRGVIHSDMPCLAESLNLLKSLLNASQQSRWLVANEQGEKIFTLRNDLRIYSSTWIYFFCRLGLSHETDEEMWAQLKKNEVGNMELCQGTAR